MQFYNEIKKILPKSIKLCINSFLRFPFYLKAKKDPKWITDRNYYNIFEKPINYDNPSDLNEKIHWLKFYSDTSQWSRLADKYKVREYVIEKGLEHILNELYAVYEKASEIDIAKLPDSFVMKMNNGSGDILIVEDKSQYTNKEVEKYFKKFKEYGVMLGEYHYLKIEPRIIVEKLLVENNNAESLIDYKFYCFDGTVRYVLVCSGRSKKGVTFDTYDVDWNYLENVGVISGHYLLGKGLCKKPASFDQMIEICQTLSKDIPFVRIDLYEIDGVPVFGEMTLTPAAGFITYYNAEFLKGLGQHINLPKKTI